MKTTLLSLFISFTCLFGFSQIELQPNPSDINSGTFVLKYGEFGDYSIFDPMSNPNLYLYTGLQTDTDPLTWDYNDGEFLVSNLGQMIPLTYDNTLGYYIATFNPKTRTYFEEATLSMTTIPENTEVFDWYFLITTNDLSRQSADLKGTDYGFNSSTVLDVDNYTNTNDIIVLNGSIKFLKQGQYNLSVYDVLGKRIKKETINNSGELLYDLKLRSSGLYIVQITSGSTKKTVKVLKH
ncbi:T9SS type A sorting domain-containing protein [Psychroserpens luteus]|uniref:T9SS type A sorting domain-containing protein n=1 Tax=Psychroserpens luteus TaxID=1434066 RepID=A0ABW5ZSI6_9FLAO|nr:T9SS type A sorting domain-containing protein [Psychroserpens luteus]